MGSKVGYVFFFFFIRIMNQISYCEYDKFHETIFNILIVQRREPANNVLKEIAKLES